MLTTFAIAGLGVAIVGLVASALLWMRERARESSAAETDAVATDGLAEMRALGQRIETLVGQQQLQGATDRQHLAQKIDAVGEHLEQQRNGLSGLQNELRHEVNRRDAEMDEFRTQLASIQHATALGSSTAGRAPLALPPAVGAPLADTSSEVPSVFEMPAVETSVFEVPTFDASAFEAPAFEMPAALEGSAFEMPAFETLGADDPAAETPAPFPAEPMGDGLATDFGEAPSADGWDTGVPPSGPPPEATAGPVFSDPFAFVDPFAAPQEAAPEGAASPQEAAPQEAAPQEAAPTPDLDEPVVAAGAEFEPFDVASLGDLQPFDPSSSPVEDGLLPLDPPPADRLSLFEDVSFGSPAGSAFRDVPMPSAPAAFPAASPLSPPSDSAWIARADRPAIDAPMFAPETGASATVAFPAFEAPAFEAPAFDAPAFGAPTFDALAPEPTAPAAEAPPSAVTPAGADDLTVISAITDDIQRLLYAAGVTSLDEVARWSRADARRISTAVSVPEETILNQWVFEAQAALFQSFRA